MLHSGLDLSSFFRMMLIFFKKDVRCHATVCELNGLQMALLQNNTNNLSIRRYTLGSD